MGALPALLAIALALGARRRRDTRLGVSTKA
jgi:hypothetical protein